MPQSKFLQIPLLIISMIAASIACSEQLQRKGCNTSPADNYLYYSEVFDRSKKVNADGYYELNKLLGPHFSYIRLPNNAADNSYPPLITFSYNGMFDYHYDYQEFENGEYKTQISCNEFYEDILQNTKVYKSTLINALIPVVDTPQQRVIVNDGPCPLGEIYRNSLGISISEMAPW